MKTKNTITGISELNQWENEFWLYWGISPKGTPKYKAGVKAISFIRQNFTYKRDVTKALGELRIGWECSPDYEEGFYKAKEDMLEVIGL